MSRYLHGRAAGYRLPPDFEPARPARSKLEEFAVGGPTGGTRRTSRSHPRGLAATHGNRVARQQKNVGLAVRAAVESQTAAIGRPLKMVDLRTGEIRHLRLAGTIASRDPDFPAAGSIADPGDPPIGRIHRVLIPEGGRDEFQRLAASRQGRAVNVEIPQVSTHATQPPVT